MQAVYRPQPLAGYPHYDDDEMIARARRFAEEMSRRRTVRDFSPEAVPREVIEAALRAAGSAPSGTNKQPWHFAVVGDPDLKRRIRAAAEEEERAFYAGRAGARWLADLAPLGTSADKPFLEIAPWLIVCFQESYGRDPETGERT
ncbi:MAG: nitroreductase family protein, partial [Rhodothalassiaceae bacterium]